MEDNLNNEEFKALTLLGSYQLVINNMPLDKKYSEYIHHSLKQVVRTSECRVCLFFTQEPVGDLISKSCMECRFRPSDYEHKCNCILFNDKDILVLPIEIGKKCFGCIALNNIQIIKPTILAAVRNFVNVIAIAIENKLQKDALEAQNLDLLEQKHFFEQIFTQSSVSTQILDADGWCMRINPKLSEIFGVHPKNIEGKVYNIFRDEAIRQSGIIPYLESVFKEGKKTEWEVLFDIELAADSQNIIIEEKKKVWYHNWAFPIIDINGKLSHVIIQHTDITERKQSELALKEREEEFRSLAESMPQIVWTTRADGWNTYFNQQWVDYTGLTLEESYGHGWNLPFHPEDKQRAWDAWQNAVNNDAEYSIECRLRCHDGSYHWWLIRGVPQIGDGGKILKFYGTCTDIEKIKEVEHALKESENQLLHLNADKDRFISILGHDLKNPFNNIIGLSEVLAEEIKNLKIDEIEEIAHNINKTARITNHLLEDILMWAKAQQGRIAFKPRNLNFSTTCRNIIEIFNTSVFAKNITIYDSSEPHISVYADADMLKTILSNLVSNAIKFTNSGGKITIKAEHDSENVLISVSDNGIGIPSQNLAKLFDIAEVPSTKGTSGETGTGLGLLLCKEFIEKHGGKIWIESEVGKGSDFKFTLPLSAEHA